MLRLEKKSEYQCWEIKTVERIGLNKKSLYVIINKPWFPSSVGRASDS